MSISILTEPQDGQFWYLVPAYNRMPFQVQSTLASRLDMNYLCDVYYGGTLTSGRTFVGRIKSAPDETYSRGIFDVHRILESYLSPDIDWNTNGIAKSTNSCKRYVVSFGEEFSSKNYFTNAISRASGPWAGRVQLTFAAGHNLLVNDAVYTHVDNFPGGNTSPVPGLSYGFVVEVIDSTNVTINWIYGAGAYTTGYITEGETYTAATNVNGYAAFSLYNATRYKTGDQFMSLDISNTFYNGTWSVKGLSGTNMIISSIPYSGASGGLGVLTHIGNVTTTGVTDSTSYTYMFNGVNQYDEIRTTTGLSRLMTPFMLIDSTSNFLTNSPSGQTIESGQSHSLAFLSHNDFGATTPTTQIRGMLYFTSGGSRQFDIYMGTNYQPTAVADYLRFSVGIGPKNLDSAVTSSKITGGTINWPTVSHYDVYAFATGLTQTSVTKRFTLEEPDCKYETYRLKFLNRLGGWDYFNFKKRSDVDLVVDKTTWTKRAVSGNYGGHLIGAKGESIMNIDAIQKYTVNSDWLTEEQSLWLDELITSTDVYWIYNNQIYPIIIETNSKKRGIKANQPMFNLTIQFRTAYKVETQRN